MSIERVGRMNTYPILHSESWERVVCDNCKEKIGDDPDHIEAGTVLVLGKAADAHYCAECVARACPRCRMQERWTFVDYIDRGYTCDQCLEEDDREGTVAS